MISAEFLSKTARKAEIVTLRSVAWCAILILVADIVLPGEWKAKLAPHVPFVTLLLLSLFALAYLGHAHLRPKFAHAIELGLGEIYPSRTDEDQIKAYHDLLSHTEQELFIVGITLKDLSGQAQYLDDLAKKGCKIDLLMLSPKFRDNKEPVLDTVAYAAGPRMLENNFCRAISDIRLLARQIRDNNAQKAANGRLAVRFYSTIPTVGLTARDGTVARGRMHVEVVPHQITASPFRPILAIHKTGDDRDLFTEFYRRYRMLWDESTAYIQVDRNLPGGMEVNDALDQQVSRWLRLPSRWQDGLVGRAANP